jgi:hypothetical protein
MFRSTLPDFVPLSVADDGFVLILAWWDDHQRALRPDQDPAATRCGFLLLAIIDGNAAAVCAAVCGGFVGL